MSDNYRNSHDSAETLKMDGKISPESAKALKQGANRQIQVPDLTNTFDDPVFSYFLVDSSSSMDACRQSVIDSHPLMLDALRGSAKCRHEALYVGEYLFNTAPQQLHHLIPLAPKAGADKVVVLDQSKYKPSGRTALYKTLYLLLQDMASVMVHCAQTGLEPQFTIGLITDGEDTENGANPADIRRFLDELRAQTPSPLRCAVIIGLTNNQFSKDVLEQIRATLGFDQAITCGQNSPREIRRAFLPMSQSAISAQD